MIALEAFASICLLVGAAFMLVASLGVARMPDLFSRMQAAAKAGTVAIGLLLLGLSLELRSTEATLRAVAVLVFYLLTAPVATHMIARAAYLVGVPLWHGTHPDELREHIQAGREVPAGDAGREIQAGDSPGHDGSPHGDSPADGRT